MFRVEWFHWIQSRKFLSIFYSYAFVPMCMMKIFLNIMIYNSLSSIRWIWVELYIFLPNLIPWKQLNQKIAEQKKVAMRIHDTNWQYRLLLFLSAIFIALSIWFIRNKDAPLQSINHLFLFLVLDIIYNTEDVTNTQQRSQKEEPSKIIRLVCMSHPMVNAITHLFCITSICTLINR